MPGEPGTPKPPKARKCPNCDTEAPDTDVKCPNKDCGLNLKRFDELVQNEDTPILEAIIKAVLRKSSQPGTPPPASRPRGWFN